jgi:hypothetical protein
MFEHQDLELGELWEPTKEEFAAYRAREVELAQANCEFLEREYGMHAVRAANTLHTAHTVRAEEVVSPCNPSRVAMGSFMLGFQAMLRARNGR